MPQHNAKQSCIFCSGTGKLSREHIFGEWLRADFPRDAATTHTHGVIKVPVPGSGLSQPAMATRQRQGHSGSKKVRVVCKKCNETWMSALENTTKPIVQPLIRGLAIVLTPEMQTMLATWAAKTVITAEHVDPAQALITQDERNQLKGGLTPPQRGWHVWIALTPVETGVISACTSTWGG